MKVMNMSRERFTVLLGRCEGDVLIHLNDGSVVSVKQNAGIIGTLGIPAEGVNLSFTDKRDSMNFVFEMIGRL